MNTSVFKIISHLVKRMLNSEQEAVDEEKLISTLQEEGYELNDINQAFEFIFSSSEIIDMPEKITEDDDNQDNETESNRLTSNENKQRILDFRERFKFNLNVQGIIIKLNYLNLITEEELETVIAKSVATHKPRLDTLDFWEVLEGEIDDEFKLTALAEEIPEFRIINAGEREYAH
ncbi:hypothetical protein JCM16358_07860 [Halanaerocella petrolearia]